MTRTPVSIVIPVWNLAQVTQECLEALSPTLGDDDQVVVVDNGSTDDTAEVLARHDWVEVVSHEQNLGFAAGCNAGAEQARNPITIFLNNDTLPVGDWIGPLVAPFADPDVGATGPVSNFVSGSQLHEESYGAPVRGMKDVRALALAAMATGRGKTWPTHRLVGFALAVRTALFEQVGGFDESFETGGYEDDELCRRLQAAGAHLVVVAGSYVYHLGHATFDGNGLDWVGIEHRNREVMLAKAREMPVLSLVVDCADGFEESARSMIELVDLVHLKAELVLVEHGDQVARSLAEQVSGGDVVVVECPPDADGVRRGLAAATGRRRVSIRSGETVDAAALREFAADPSADYTARHVGIDRAQASLPRQRRKAPTRLIATLLVRDEIDVVAATVEHVLDQGAELVVATDNGSVDGTREVLAAYQEAGVLHLIDEPEHTHRQGTWVTRMASWATERGADWLLHLDADEFWVPVDRSRTLAQLLGALPDEQGLVVAQRTDLVSRRDAQGPWTERLVWRNLHTVSERGTPLLPKVCHRAAPGISVAEGNHSVRGAQWQIAPDGLVDLYHVPLRSWEQFSRKIANGGSALAANTELDPGTGWHWRADYERLRAGSLQSTYESRLLDDDQTADGLRSGTIRRDTYLRDHLADLVERAVRPDLLGAVVTSASGGLVAR